MTWTICETCGYGWDTKSKRVLVTCSSCNAKTPVGGTGKTTDKTAISYTAGAEVPAPDAGAVALGELCERLEVFVDAVEADRLERISESRSETNEEPEDLDEPDEDDEDEDGDGFLLKCVVVAILAVAAIYVALQIMKKRLTSSSPEKTAENIPERVYTS